MSWLKRLFARQRLYGDLSEEIREHLEEKIEELVAGGMSRKEATYAARREFGNVRLAEEDSRAVWRWAAIEDLVMDVRFQAWIRRRKITPPKPTLDGARSKRLWTESDLARLLKVKENIYWTGQGRPRKKK